MVDQSSPQPLPRVGCLVVHGISDVLPGDTARAAAVRVSGAPVDERRVQAGDYEAYAWCTEVDGREVVFLDGGWADLSATPTGLFGVLFVAWRQLVRIPALAIRETRLAGWPRLALLLQGIGYGQAVVLPAVMTLLGALFLCMTFPSYVLLAASIGVGLGVGYVVERQGAKQALHGVLAGAIAGAGCLFGGGVLLLWGQPEVEQVDLFPSPALQHIAPYGALQVGFEAGLVALCSVLPALIVGVSAHGAFSRALTEPGYFERPRPEPVPAENDPSPGPGPDPDPDSIGTPAVQGRWVAGLWWTLCLLLVALGPGLVRQSVESVRSAESMQGSPDVESGGVAAWIGTWAAGAEVVSTLPPAETPERRRERLVRQMPADLQVAAEVGDVLAGSGVGDSAVLGVEALLGSVGLAAGGGASVTVEPGFAVPFALGEGSYHVDRVSPHSLFEDTRGQWFIAPRVVDDPLTRIRPIPLPNAEQIAIESPTRISHRIVAATHHGWVVAEWLMATVWFTTMGGLALVFPVFWLFSDADWRRAVGVVGCVLPGMALFVGGYLMLVGAASLAPDAERMVVSNGRDFAVLEASTTQAGADDTVQGWVRLYGSRCDSPGTLTGESLEILGLDRLFTASEPERYVCYVRDVLPSEFATLPLGPSDLLIVVSCMLVLAMVGSVLVIHVLPGAASDSGMGPLFGWWIAPAGSSKSGADVTRTRDRLDWGIRQGPSMLLTALLVVMLVAFFVLVAETCDLISIGAMLELHLGVMLRFVQLAGIAIAASITGVLSATQMPLDLVQDAVRFFDGGQRGFVEAVVQRQRNVLEAARRNGVERVLVVAHSQGTLVAAALLRSEGEEGRIVRDQVTGFVTLGSPLNSIYARWMPNVAHLACTAMICDDLAPCFRKNLYFHSDYVGRRMWHADGVPRHCDARNVGEDIALGYGGHTRYFDLSIPATERVGEVIRAELPGE